MNAWSDWVRTITGNASSRALAMRIERSHPTAQNWMKKPTSPEAVIVLAHAYGACVVEGFVAAGWLTEEDLAKVRRNLSQASDIQLTGELHRRAVMRARSEHPDMFDDAYRGKVVNY